MVFAENLLYVNRNIKILFFIYIYYKFFLFGVYNKWDNVFLKLLVVFFF